ncbi:MAG TPA: D-hexose-6-phosphate mutarotase [Thermomonas sp.]|jgi:glucose-6-phosphate 1-epimerase|nr:D-hexose-6-phosphate mutarotase [Thermomonas sp.]HQY49220.1 D-hexose-6-phosphate mutarotase [Thermomonas sp.]HRA56035.1 D-hexose-6-phosphate mutarotase [Thermomonas sp.]
MHAQPEIGHGLPCLRLTQQGASALVALHGAQVLSWKPDDGRERLFVSTRAVFDGKAAIRGGIPVIFPQFGERGTLRRHGFARNQPWRFAGVRDAAAVFELQYANGDALWPYPCVARLHIALSASRLCVTLEIENTGDAAFAFTAALHTYLRVEDIAQVAIAGLQGCDFEDSANGGTLHRQSDFEVRCSGETDRIYNDVVAPLMLVDGARQLCIEQTGFADAVVWNPGESQCMRIGDLAPQEWQQFVCVEAGQVLQPVLLPAGERWRGMQCLG